MSGEELNQTNFDELARESARILDERIIASLERGPEVSISADFAARVAAKVPARKPVAVSSTHYGWTAMWAGLALLFMVLVAIGVKGAAGSVVGTAVEWTLLVQFLVFATWLVLRKRTES